MKHQALRQKLMVSNDQGSLLVICLFTVVVLLGISAAFMLLVTSELRMADRQRLETTAFHVAEAGIERGIYDLRRDFEIDSGETHPWTDGDINDVTVNFTDTVTYEPLRSNVAFHDGIYSLTLRKISADYICLRSVGTVDNVSSTIEVYARITDLNPWGNAIFAGEGASGTTINGNVNIAGSVLILASSLTDTDTAVDIVILSGNAEIVANNYNNLSSTLKAKVPALELTDADGDGNVDDQTLNAVLRVRRGRVSLSGSATVGSSDSPNNGQKETVDAVYVTDGFSGNQGASSVYSDNGTSEAYDLGESVVFPSLDDPAEGYSSSYEYFENEGYTLTAGDISDLNNMSSKTSFTFGDANGSASWDGSTLTVNGMLYVNDETKDITLGNSKTDVVYSGEASILAKGNVNIEGNLITSGNNSFPDSILGVMTAQSLMIGTSSQLDVMGMFYAEGAVATNKQTEILGSIVSNYFDFSGQVPSIFQVPAAASKLPKGMIAGSTKWYAVAGWIKK